MRSASWAGPACIAVSILSARGQETPLTSIPYTPSLETRYMDRSADPCTDFYKYACGAWNKLNPIPPDQSHWDVYGKLANENQRFLWGLLEQVSQGGPARQPNEQKIGDFFHACMDLPAIEAAGARPLDPALATIAKLNSVEEIAAYLADQHKTGIDLGVLFGFSSSPNFEDSSQEMAFAEAGGLGLPDRDYYTKTDAKSQEIRQRYVQHMERMFQMLGESASDAQADAQETMGIETALAHSSLTRVEKRNPYNLKHFYSRDDLRRLTPAFDWDTYLKQVGAPEFTEANVTEPKFFAELNTLFSEQKLPACTPTYAGIWCIPPRLISPPGLSKRTSTLGVLTWPA